MTPKEQYIQLREQWTQMPIFMQPWWMDAVCAGRQWDVFVSFDSEGQLRAAMPYMLSKHWRLRYVSMPQQTPAGGVWLREDVLGSEEQLAQVACEMAEYFKAQKLQYLSCIFTSGQAAALRLRDAGFRVKEKCAYQVSDLADLEAVIKRFSRGVKRQLQKALSLHVDSSMLAEDFYRFYLECYASQHKHIAFTREFFLVLYQKTQRLNHSKIIRVMNADNETLAAAFVVWDEQSAYYLISCVHASAKDSGAEALLVLEAIKTAKQQ